MDFHRKRSKGCKIDYREKVKMVRKEAREFAKVIGGKYEIDKTGDKRPGLTVARVYGRYGTSIFYIES